jgi:hypothetical protein
MSDCGDRRPEADQLSVYHQTIMTASAPNSPFRIDFADPETGRSSYLVAGDRVPRAWLLAAI